MPFNPKNPAALGAWLKGDDENAMLASTPGGIAAQEKAGQTMLVASGTLLPLKVQAYPELTREQITAGTGIQFGMDQPGSLFVRVALPPGWKIVPTDHDMWSSLVDTNGCERAGIFYKAAFYDRNAHVSFTPRYSVQVKYNDELGIRIVYVLDRQTKDQHAIGECSTNPDAYRDYDRLCTEGEAWLKETYPEYRDPFAYWINEASPHLLVDPPTSAAQESGK